MNIVVSGHKNTFQCLLNPMTQFFRSRCQRVKGILMMNAAPKVNRLSSGEHLGAVMCEVGNHLLMYTELCSKHAALHEAFVDLV